MPHPGPQTIFHQVDAYEAFFGGSKGPGKTESIIREGLRQINNSKYRACILRRTFPQLGECIDRTFKYFKRLRAKYSDHDIQLKLPAWTFPSGAKYAFSHLQHEKDKHNHQGKEWHYMAFDQLEQFTETQYLYMLAQNRTSDSAIRCYVRSTGNPGGVGHGWVKRRFIDPFLEHPGQVKWFKRNEFDEDIECSASEGISRTFVPANVYDNPSIIEKDPEYLKRLNLLNQDDKQAFLFGNWDIFKGQFFKMWRKSIHVVERELKPEYFKFLSMDYGYAAPASVGWWMVDFNGRMHKYRELYGEGFEYDVLAEKVKGMTPPEEKINYCVADPAIWSDKEHHISKKQAEAHGESGAQTIQRIWNGFTSLMKADNSRITGWGRMRIMLNGENGIPFMTFSPRCKNSIRTIPELIHDELNVEDVDSSGEDHAGDESRYAAMSRASIPEPPKEYPKNGAMNAEIYDHYVEQETNREEAWT